MTIRLIAYFACIFFIAQGNVEASSNQSFPKEIIGLVQVACESNALPQCQEDCEAQKYNCDLGHSDELPCQQYYSKCMVNCQNIVKCDEETDSDNDEWH